ncbi:Gfo/Idh/MocA family oxidoreductase [Aquibacillus albus]|uniref:Dehydrogenase n=1 Tax=Aquibacillus albus TaxID=1168171 RepID=A0ABS2N275_9BACI|nr:Gfo/Idh/MocA family oxidoreductase [Aquibacillus albus]MBM7572153.1 putative dehydrogenase [Aquibacillus albus]
MKKIGIIGLSEGNGHPYSWSAAFNGYNVDVMKDCPYPVIPQYLSQQNFPHDAIRDAKVSHIWTQDKYLSKHIAKASYINNIVEDYKEMIGKVDAILLARDDYKNHVKMSLPFIQAGLPIFIDKPISISKKDIDQIFEHEQYNGQIFTASITSGAKEFKLSSNETNKIGKLEYIDATVMKRWDKYAIHIIEPVLNLIGEQGKIVSHDTLKTKEKTILSLHWESGLVTTFSSLGEIPTPISIRLFGEKNHKELVFLDTFYALKATLQRFIDIIQKKEDPLNKNKVYQIVDIIERGLHK